MPPPEQSRKKIGFVVKERGAAYGKRAKGQREVEERNESGLLTLTKRLFTGYTVRRGEEYRKTITLSLTN